MKALFNLATGLLLSGLCLAAPLAASAQKKPAPAARKTTPANAEAAIRESDIKRDLYALGGDHFRGREGGTLDELKASVWLAEQIRAIGLQPAGDDGTYFQWFHIQRTRLTRASKLSIGTHQLKPNQDALIFAPTNYALTAPLLYVGTGTAAELAKVDINGKAVALLFSGNPTADMSFRRYLSQVLRDRSAELMKAGAAAVVFVADPRAQVVYEHWGHTYERGRYGLPGDPNVKVIDTAPIMLLPESAKDWVQQAGQQLVVDLKAETFQYPSVNIVAKVPGTDAQLKKENVLFSTHQDTTACARPWPATPSGTGPTTTPPAARPCWPSCGPSSSSRPGARPCSCTTAPKSAACWARATIRPRPRCPKSPSWPCSTPR